MPFKNRSALNTASSTYSLKIVSRFETSNTELSEKIIHVALKSFRIKNRREWFYIKDDFELAYTIKTIKNCIIFSQKFNFKDYNEFKNTNTDLNINQQLEEINNETVLQQEIKAENSKKCKLNGQQMSNKSGNYKGVCWEEEKQKWSCRLKKDYKTHFLGYYSTELDAAKSYNDYALYLNQTDESMYTLNNIDGYLPVPRDIPTETKVKILENKSCKFTGVTFVKSRNHYRSCIKLNGKSLQLGCFNNELDAAKSYNQQALYFNEQNNTNYVLNDIKDYITIPIDIYSNKVTTKSSKYYGVTLNKQTNKYKALLVYNKKQIYIGTFINELDAAEAYNKKANELNEKNDKLIYKINKFEKRI